MATSISIKIKNLQATFMKLQFRIKQLYIIERILLKIKTIIY